MIKKLLENIRFYFLKKKCDHLHKIDGKQYFIVPVVTREKYSMQIINNQLHKDYNKKAKKMGRPQIQYSKLLEIALYKTKTGTLTR